MSEVIATHAMVFLKVADEHHRLRLHRGVDHNTGEVGRLHCFRAGRHCQTLLQQRLKLLFPQSARRGCGPSPSGIRKIERKHTATRRRVRPRSRPSPRVGGVSESFPRNRLSQKCTTLSKKSSTPFLKTNLHIKLG